MTEAIDYDLEMLRAASHHAPDWFLQVLVAMVNRGQMTFGVTLIAGGAVVSGHVIGGAEYFKILGQQFAGATGQTQDESAETFGAIIKELYPTSPATGESPTSDPQPSAEVTATFIHLKNAKVFHGSVQLPQDATGLLWRGRLAEVDGFTFGELQQTRF